MNSFLVSLSSVVAKKDSALFAEFIKQNGVNELVCGIKESASHCTMDSVLFFNDIAWFIFVERQSCAFGEVAQFITPNELIQFQELVYSLGVFITLGVPFAHWEFVARKLFSLLRDLPSVSKSSIDEFMAVVSSAKEQILTKKEYQQGFADYLNGAL